MDTKRKENLNKDDILNGVSGRILSISNIIKNIIFVMINILAISSIFDIEIVNKGAFIFFGITIGMTRYFLKELHISYRMRECYENIIPVLEAIIVLERTIRKLQKLITNEDLILQSKKEIDNELDKLKKS